MNWNITHPTSEEEAAQIAQFQVDMAKESESLILDPNIVMRGVLMAMEDPSGKGRYYVAKTTEPYTVEEGLTLPAGTVAGSLFVTREWSDWHGEWYWWVQSVYVRPTFRRMGAYRALYAKVVEEAKRANIHEVRLYVDRDNTRAQQTYQALGMQESHYLLYEHAL